MHEIHNEQSGGQDHADDVSKRHDPITPLPETFLPPPAHVPAQRQRVVLVICTLILVSLALLPVLFTQRSPLLTVQTQVGQLSFGSSGQLDPTSSMGLNDVVTLSLPDLSVPRAGMSYYVWLMSEKTQDAPILLGKLQPAGSLLYSDAEHTNLLAKYSRVLITQEGARVPASPSPQTQNWRAQGQIVDVPIPGDEQGYSLLSHLRHLVASDPTLGNLGLAGGLDIWLYRNTGKLFEWSNAARDGWATESGVALVRRQIIRVVQYLDGEGSAGLDLPAGTPWLVDAKAGHFGLIDPTGTSVVSPSSYISHIKKHLDGMISAPGATAAQSRQAAAIKDALSHIETELQKVRSAAVQLSSMSDAEIKSQGGLSLLNDMQVGASLAYIGGQDGATPVPGVVKVHDVLQGLATIPITTVAS